MDATPDVTGGEAKRIAVPASLFLQGPEPGFVLFDRHGRLADPLAARTVYVSPSDMPMLDRFLRRNLAGIVASRRVAAAARAWALHRLLLADVEQAIAGLPDSWALQRAMPVIEVAAVQVAAEPGVYLAQVARAGGSRAARAVATALHAVTLAAAEGIDDHPSLVQVAVAGTFADASPLVTPELLRAGPVEAGDRALVRSHPEHAADLLHRAGVRTRRTLEAVRFHHERWDGAGYPRGVHGAAIPVEARIVRIADAYATLTGEGPDAPGLRGYEALLDMAQAQGEFDPRLLRLFVRALGRALNVNARWSPLDERESRAEEAGAA